MKILVTGGAGYIGSHTCKALRASGYEPITIDNLIYGHEWAVQWGPFYNIDIRDTQKLTEILQQEKVAAVVHFAAFAYVGESMREPMKYFENNVLGTISLLSAMRAAQVRNIVFSSTCATYGIPDKTPIEESFAQNPINPYGRTKLMIEHILKDLAEAENFRSVSLRYFNAAGADENLEVGELHEPETHIIPLAIRAAFDSQSPLTIFGTDYPTPDGTCVRDYIHVSDLARAHVLALDSLLRAKEVSAAWRAYNLGTGRGYSVKEIVSGLESILSRKIHIQLGERRPGDPPVLVAAPGRAEKDLGWQPTSSSLEHILRSAVGWCEKMVHK